MSKNIRNSILCSIFIVSVFVLIYFIFFHNPVVIEGLTELAVKDDTAVAAPLIQPISCSKTYKRFNTIDASNVCPLTFQGIACHDDCQPAPQSSLPSTTIHDSQITGWGSECGCWPLADPTKKDLNYAYTGSRMSDYNSGNFPKAGKKYNAAAAAAAAADAGAAGAAGAGAAGAADAPSSSQKIKTFETTQPKLYNEIIKALSKNKKCPSDQNHMILRAMLKYSNATKDGKTCTKPSFEQGGGLGINCETWYLYCGPDSKGTHTPAVQYCLDEVHNNPHRCNKDADFMRRCSVECIQQINKPPGTYAEKYKKSVKDTHFVLYTPPDACPFIHGQDLLYTNTTCKNNPLCDWDDKKRMCIIKDSKQFVNKTTSSITSPSTEGASGYSQNDDLFDAVKTIINHSSVTGFFKNWYNKATGATQTISEPSNPNQTGGINVTRGPITPTNLHTTLPSHAAPKIQAGATGLSYPLPSTSGLSPANISQPMTCGGPMPYPYNCVSTQINF